jgi:pimeloyl-ACP methyl ester carboxylesterase
MHSRNVRALVFFVLFYVTFGAILTWQQERLIYLPSGDVAFGDCPLLREAEPRTYEAARFYYYEASPTAPLVIIYHGNAGTACHRGDYLTPLLRTQGLSYLLVVYPGYDGDRALPSHTRMKEAALSVATYIEENVTVPTIVLGESIGSGIATWHLSNQTPDALVLITPLTTLSAVAREQFWFYPTSLLVRDVFAVDEALADFPGPLLLVHGTNDTIVPIVHSQRIAEMRAGNTELAAIADANHNDLMGYTATQDALSTFLRTYKPR